MLEYSEACERNKEPILAVLTAALAERNRVLEIGSGTGQHAVFFARHLARLSWQPTDRATEIPALRARVELAGQANVGAPLELDVDDEPWPDAVLDGNFDAVFTANTLHIMSWPSVECLFRGLGGVLGSGGALCIYGPFCYERKFTSPSNERFDGMLRARDSLSGIRDFEAVNDLAAAQGLKLVADHDMPANNRLLVWHRRAGNRPNPGPTA